MCHACTVTLYAAMLSTTPRCAQPDVEATWWLEPDYEADLTPDPSLSRIERARAARLAIEGPLHQARENQLRAKLLCHQCPLYQVCQDSAWDEGYHVWGGLDPLERYRVREAGTRDILLIKQGRNKWSADSEAMKRFLAGGEADAIAAELGIKPTSVTNQARGLLSVLRRQREEESRWDWKRSSPPPLNGMSREAYRHGRAGLYTSDPTATEQMSA